jgi:hypothetical protein
MTNALTAGDNDARATGNTAKAPGVKVEDDARSEKKSNGPATDEGGDAEVVERTGGERWAATFNATQTPGPGVSTTATGTSGIVIDLSAVAVASSNGCLRQGIMEAVVDVGGSGASATKGVSVPIAEATTVRTPGKLQRAKQPADTKDASGQTAVVRAAVDMSKVAMVSMAAWHVPTHAAASQTPIGSAKGASDLSAGTKGKVPVPTPVEATTEGVVGAAAISSGAAGVDQDTSIPSPAEVFVAAFDPPAIAGSAGVSGISSAAGGGLAVGKAMPTTAAVVRDSGSLPAAGEVSAATSSASGGMDTSSRPAANGIQTAPSVQGDPSKVGAALVTPRAMDGIATQTLVQTIAHQAASPQRPDAAAPPTMAAAKAQELPAAAHSAGEDLAGASGINSAKVIQTMGETEMHVAMHSVEFGDISIRTALNQQQMVAQISLDHSDLSQAISSHLSTMQAKLGQEYGLQASIQISNQGSSLSGGQGESSQRDQQRFAGSTQGRTVSSQQIDESSSSSVAPISAGSGHGLDIRI